MTGESPLVTVGVAVYNGEDFIAEALTSILEGTYRNWELLVVNDRSPDRSVDIIRSFTDPRIRLVENEVNLGLVGVRNRILQESQGDYIAWLDQDDLAFPDRLATQVSFLETHPDYALCGAWTAMRIVADDGSSIDRPARFPESYAALRAALMFLNPIACNTVMMRRSAFADRGLAFREEFGNSLDYDLWSRASDHMPVCNIPRVLGAYRVHPGQTSQGAALERMNAHALQIQSELADRALRITMTVEDRRLHALATVSPIAITDPDDLPRIARWFALLRQANQESRAFDRALFDQAISRQWTTVTLGARRTLGTAAAGWASLAGLRTIELSLKDVASSTAEGVRRRLARRD